MISKRNNISAWELLKEMCARQGARQDIQRGSFDDGEFYRLQLSPIAIQILNPLEFETLPKDITFGMIEDYYNEYVIGIGERAPGEDYTYAERISLQLPDVLEMLRKTPATNQAAIAVSQPDDINKKYPPCLREISFSVTGRTLHISTFWRTNDIGNAFLMNQGGISLLLKDVAEYAELTVGCHYYFCSNAHIYER